MPSKTEIDHSLKIIKCIYNGQITKEDLSAVWLNLLGLTEFTEKKYNLLSDYRESNFNIVQNEGEEMLQFLISIKHILSGKKEAAILKNSRDTALSQLLQLKAYKKVGYNVKLFSTAEAAIEWLS